MVQLWALVRGDDSGDRATPRVSSFIVFVELLYVWVVSLDLANAYCHSRCNLLRTSPWAPSCEPISRFDCLAGTGFTTRPQPKGTNR